MKLVLSSSTAESISKAVTNKRLADGSFSKAVDALYADGIKPEHMFSPKDKEADRSFYASLEKAVVAGFTATVQSLLLKDTKTLSEEKKGEKRYWQQQIGSGIKDFRNGLQRRIDKANAEANGESANSTSTLEGRIQRDLTKYITQLEKVEGFKGDVVGLIKDLKSALARIK